MFHTKETAANVRWLIVSTLQMMTSSPLFASSVFFKWDDSLRLNIRSNERNVFLLYPRNIVVN